MSRRAEVDAESPLRAAGAAAIGLETAGSGSLIDQHTEQKPAASRPGTVSAAQHPSARASTAGDGAAAIQVGEWDDSAGLEVAYDPITKTYFNVTPAGEAAAAEAGAKGGAGGWEKTADGKIAACDPKAMLNALMYEALAAGDVEGVEKYLNYGARLDHREVIHEGGATPLMWAVTRRDMPMVKMLLERGADPNIADDTGRTPLLASSRMHDRELMDVLLSYPATNRNCSMHSTRITPLHIVARDGIAELVEVLLDAGADINLQSASGEAAMHFACRESHVDVVRLLLERGAYPKLRAALLDREPIHYACQAGSMEIALMLFKAGCSPYTKERSGRNAVAVARNYNHYELATTLVENERDRREGVERARVAAVRAAELAAREKAEREAEEKRQREAAARAAEAARKKAEREARERARKAAEQAAIEKSRADAKERVMKIAREAAAKRKRQAKREEKERREAEARAAEEAARQQKLREEAREKGVLA